VKAPHLILAFKVVAGMSALPKTVGELSTVIEPITTELSALIPTITNSFHTVFTSKKEDTVIQNQITDFKDKKAMYDRLFQEQEAIFQQTGVPTRKQTLQEFVLSLFFVSYFVLFITAFIYANMFYGMPQALKITVFMAVLLVPLIVIMVNFL
jgi:preprotein translocase subunit SecE